MPLLFAYTFLGPLFSTSGLCCPTKCITRAPLCAVMSSPSQSYAEIPFEGDAAKIAPDCSLSCPYSHCSPFSSFYFASYPPSAFPPPAVSSDRRYALSFPTRWRETYMASYGFWFWLPPRFTLVANIESQSPASPSYSALA